MFPMTVTIHNPVQLNAVLGALQLSNPLQASDLALPALTAEPTTAELVQIAKERSADAKEAAAAPAGKSAKANAAAAIQPTATVAADAAPEKTASAPNPSADSAAAAPQASTAAAEAITYTQVAEAITAMVKKDRAHAVAVLAQFGAKKGPDLKPEQYAAFLDALELVEA